MQSLSPSLQTVCNLVHVTIFQPLIYSDSEQDLSQVYQRRESESGFLSSLVLVDATSLYVNGAENLIIASSRF